MYSPIALLAAIAWIPTVLYLFQRFPPQRAVIVSFIAAWLFLPVINYTLPGIPDITKMNTTCYGILLATVLYDAGRITSFKFGWLDLPMLSWCLCPLASSIANDLGLYNGFSSVLDQTMTWGVPYFLGRIYLANLAGMRQLAIGVFIGGLAYVPLCIYEVRLSPQLHLMIYGYYPGGVEYFIQSMRAGGFRPMVFMNHGLMVAAWMMAATLTGIWLWKSGTIKHVWNIPIQRLVIVMLITFVLCKSSGAYILLVLGIVLLFSSSWLRTAIPVFLLILGMSLYLYQGVTGTVSGEQIYDMAVKITNEERAESLKFRLDQEIPLSEKARQRIIFGWGGFGRNRVITRDWKGDLVDKSVTDSLWIIVFGVNGVVGLVSITASMLLPPASLFILRYPASTWFHPKVAPAAVLAVALILYMLDCIINAMTNPVFALISGAISGLVLKEARTNQVTGTRLSPSRRSLAQARPN
ncbi:O-antigen ligase domain-containing protein [Microseira wollei]|uniref:O-antigen polymerase n=1 Tax=Microseira wollei NIES-4236 TaxID=2530354 RepID=A0AAV3XH09_9CYAN|nr:O-antigen ligase domain-containing protein [Microseira wollei]GET39415.1 hypothetical protein MiSe_41840 [Microseira wollei NIES-4236]